MAGPSILALLYAELDEAKLTELEALLTGIAATIRPGIHSKVLRIRRGHVWNLWIKVESTDGIRERPYWAAVQRIDELEEEDLELLVNGNGQMEAARARLMISAGLNSKVDYEQIELLAQRIVAKFGGIAGAAIK